MRVRLVCLEDGIMLAVCRPPRRLFDWALRRVEGSATPQPEYPKPGTVLRTAYQAKRVFEHMRFMDFSIIPGWSGYVAWRIGLVRLWQRRFKPRPPRPQPKVRRSPDVATGTPVAAPIRRTIPVAVAVADEREGGARRSTG